MTARTSFLLGLVLGIAVALLPAQATEQSWTGEVVDHILLLLPNRAPARFLGPDLRLREIRCTLNAASSDAPRVRGTMTFARMSALQKKLRALREGEQEFDLVIYVLVRGELERLRFARAKVVSGEKNVWEWTAAGFETQRVNSTRPLER